MYNHYNFQQREYFVKIWIHSIEHTPRKMLPFDDVMMILLASLLQYIKTTKQTVTKPCASFCYIYILKQRGKQNHHDVIKWKHFPRYWPFVRGIHWSPVNSPHKGQWRWALMFYMHLNKPLGKQSCGGDLRRHRARYNDMVMWCELGVCSIEWIQNFTKYSRCWKL